MTKANIANRLHEVVGISEQEADDLLEWVLDLFKSTLRRDEEICITGFGKFRVRS